MLGGDADGVGFTVHALCAGWPAVLPLRALKAGPQRPADRREGHAQHGGDHHEQDLGVGQVRLGGSPVQLMGDHDRRAEQRTREQAASRARACTQMVEAGTTPPRAPMIDSTA